VNSRVCLCLLVSFFCVSSNLIARDGATPTAVPSKAPLAGAASTAAPSNASSADASPATFSRVVIPGSQRSFLRMAAISQQIAPEELLPLLSRNVFMLGYENSSRPTEFLVLLRRYVVQARELGALAASTGMDIRVSNCEDASPLLRILGFRVGGHCGAPDAFLSTEDPQKAFVTIDSGFPLPALERALQGGKPFEYAFSSSQVPALFVERDWTAADVKRIRTNRADLLDTILNDSAVARLYWALSRLDPDTSRFLQQSIGIQRLLPYAAVLDFYGREICVSGGRVLVPGGNRAESAWKDLVGASPASPANFVMRLLAKDKGWLAAYFDVLSRTNGVQRSYFTDPQRLRFFYDALRAPDPSSPATVGSFRPAPALLQIVTRLRLDHGEPLIPGNLAVWRNILFQGPDAGLVRKWTRTRALNSPDQLIQIMFALSRAPIAEPLHIYMAISEIDGRRLEGNRLKPETVQLLAKKFAEFGDQYPIFSEFPELSDKSIAEFFEVAEPLNSASEEMRANALGLFQANIGIWQILARQRQISEARLDESWQQVLKPFARIRSAAQLYDAGRTSLGETLRFSTGKPSISQNEIIELLAGPNLSSKDAKQMQQAEADRIRSVLNDQRLVSLDTLFIVGDALSEKERGKEPAEYVLALANETRGFEMPRPIFTNGERTEWAAGIYNNHHTDVQMRADVEKVLKSSSASHAQIEDARGQLASFLRDTLVGLNYAYYEPPGAQALHNNPLFVRSHDFACETLRGLDSVWRAPVVLGQGSPAGGGAHFVGSLADLPYALAEVEQDFISPDNTQALIWDQLVPEVITAAILPRWWHVSPLELHAVALYQRSGEELLTASEKDEALRSEVMSILSERLLPPQSWNVEQGLRAGRISEILPQMMPADTFYLAVEFQRRFSQQFSAVGSAAQELSELLRQHQDQVSWNRISRDFGTPHPSMAENYGLELLNVTPMPPLSGDASRFMAESWDSPNLFWARLADEAGYSPVLLNRLVPELTLVMVKKIFATDLEDWPALLRAMHETGADFQEGKLTSTARISAALH